MLPADLTKTREIFFSNFPKGQAEQALLLLSGLDDMEVQLLSSKNAITISYNILQYTLQGIESALISQNFHLDNNLLQKIRRALAYYCEEIQRENLKVPERPQKSQQVFVHAYEHHPHGDHDETPLEWREYR